MSPIKVGFVGLSTTGWAATCLGPSLLKSSSYSLTAVSTTSPQSAAASAEKQSGIVGHPIKAFYGDTSQIANDADVDLVVVAVKAPAHKAALLPAIEAGKDVFVEWPAGANSKDTAEIAAAAKAKGVKNMVGLQGRQAPVIKKVKEILGSGKIGKILSSSIIALAPRELGFWGPTVGERNEYTTDVNGGATMLDIAMGHQLDVVTYLLGEYVSVSAVTAQHYPIVTLIDGEHKPTGKTITATALDQVAFTGLFKSGAVSSITWRGGLASTKGRKQFIWEIDGEEGSIRMEGDEIGSAFVHIRNPKLYLNGELVEVPQTSGPVDNLTAAWEAFAKGEEYPTFEDAVKNHRLIDAITQSAQEGRIIRLL